MEFGRVLPEELDKVNFDLPPEPAFNKKVLKGKPVKNPKIYIGCAKWGAYRMGRKNISSQNKRKRFSATLCGAL